MGPSQGMGELNGSQKKNARGKKTNRPRWNAREKKIPQGKTAQGGWQEKQTKPGPGPWQTKKKLRVVGDKRKYTNQTNQPRKSKLPSGKGRRPKEVQGGKKSRTATKKGVM